MSLCRFSSDNFRCDVYLYEDCGGGFSLHVAGSRYDEPIPEVPPVPVGQEFGSADWDAYFIAHQAQSDYLQDAGSTPIGLPYDGQHFFNIDAEQVVSLLVKLKDCGYKFPEYVIAAMQEELQEQQP